MKLTKKKKKIDKEESANKCSNINAFIKFLSMQNRPTLWYNQISIENSNYTMMILMELVNYNDNVKMSESLGKWRN